jgi:hypothetical protein
MEITSLKRICFGLFNQFSAFLILGLDNINTEVREIRGGDAEGRRGEVKDLATI